MLWRDYTLLGCTLGTLAALVAYLFIPHSIAMTAIALCVLVAMTVHFWDCAYKIDLNLKVWHAFHGIAVCVCYVAWLWGYRATWFTIVSIVALAMLVISYCVCVHASFEEIG